MKFLLLSFFLTFYVISFSQVENETCYNNVTGKVLSKVTTDPISKAFVQLKLDGVIVDELHTDVDGHFSFNLKCDKRYQVSATIENYSKGIKLIFTTKIISNHDVVLELIPIREFKEENNNKYVFMDRMDFEPDGYSLTKEIQLQLDFVVELMLKYSKLNIEIEFHSNNMGDLEFLKDLTQKRANSCLTYLVNKGVESSRLVAIGFGFTAPVPECDSEDMRQKKLKCTQNHRTDFRVTSDLIE